MTIEALYAVTALDGRYAEQLSGLGSIVSEGALIRYRVMVEAAWMLHMGDTGIIELEPEIHSFLSVLAGGTVARDVPLEVKGLELTTNHDVKAVEYWLKAKLEALGASKKVLAHIHFACTSEDINNLAYALMQRDIREKIVIPTFDKIIQSINHTARELKTIPMLSRTHGQSATPTTMGKEFAVYAYRLYRQRRHLGNLEILGKFNGAVGNFNAHLAAFPAIDWPAVSQSFVEKRLGFTWNPLTTQIESHDSFVEFMTLIRQFNSILLDFSRDMWGYISLGYFAQKVIAGEVGSSTMPHKVNPIYFENAEGNIGLANSLLGHFSDKLPVSRWQRDLSDSTVLRATGTAVGHSLLAWKNLLKGLDRVAANPARMREDLANAWEVLAEPVQTVMRRYGVVDAYERLKAATRGEPVVTRAMIHAAIDQTAEIPQDEKARMKSWTPDQYVGLAPDLVANFSPLN